MSKKRTKNKRSGSSVVVSFFMYCPCRAKLRHPDSGIRAGGRGRDRLDRVPGSHGRGGNTAGRARRAPARRLPTSGRSSSAAGRRKACLRRCPRRRWSSGRTCPSGSRRKSCSRRQTRLSTGSDAHRASRPGATLDCGIPRTCSDGTGCTGPSAAFHCRHSQSGASTLLSWLRISWVAPEPLAPARLLPCLHSPEVAAPRSCCRTPRWCRWLIGSRDSGQSADRADHAKNPENPANPESAHF